MHEDNRIIYAIKHFNKTFVIYSECYDFTHQYINLSITELKRNLLNNTVFYPGINRMIQFSDNLNIIHELKDGFKINPDLISAIELAVK